MKKIIFTLLTILMIFLIYYFNSNKNIYYCSIGDFLSYGNNSYSEHINKHYKNKIDKYINISNPDDYRVTNLINDINDNKEITVNKEKMKLQNILIKSNYITLSIGMNDILNKKNITYDYIDQLLNDIEQLFILIRKYNKDRIDYLSFYDVINNNELIEYTNKRLEKICKKNNINYIDISELGNIYSTKEQNKYITDQILNFTKK
jgi:hypothetical protein